jgi:hypothetical protein
MQNPSSRNQKQTDMIKDEYFNINDCNNVSLATNSLWLTADLLLDKQIVGDVLTKMDSVPIVYSV